MSVSKITNRRGVGNKDEARFAARQIILTCRTLDDPIFGLDPKDQDSVWGEFIGLLEGDAELQGLAPLIRATIEGDAIPTWDRERSIGGYSDAAAENLGFTSPVAASEAPPPVAGGELVEPAPEEEGTA